jgi:hypothetical protein
MMEDALIVITVLTTFPPPGDRDSENLREK